MIHCGHDQTTPCCAYCGAELDDNRPLDWLLRHVQSSTRTLRSRLAGREARVEQMEDARKRERGRHACGKIRRSLQKWTSWEKALAEVIEKVTDERETEASKR